jgi:asparagine synthase (glutamine-hydrolysing)
MLQAQRAYGRHSAQSNGPAISLARRLHPTLPEDRFDKGPLAEGPWRFAADVRLDNRDDLAEGLCWSTAALARTCDSALLFQALQTWGVSALDRVVGDFAFAWFDERDQSLVLARDFIGERPLFFSRGKGFVAFASMPSGLHAIPEVPRDFDGDAVAKMLTLFPARGRQTIYRQVERVPPGHIIRLTRDSTTCTAYWQAPSDVAETRDGATYEEGLREVVDRAVASRLRRIGGPLGSQLSSGLDSSIITSSAALQVAPEELHAFTAVPRAGFDGPCPDGQLADESGVAADLCALYPNIRHWRVEASSETFLEVIEKELAYVQFPPINPCNAAWGRDIHRLARSLDVRVLLVGFRGNQTLSYAGYEHLPDLIRRGRPIEALRLARQASRRGRQWPGLLAAMTSPFVPSPLWRLIARLYGKVTDVTEYTAINTRRLDWVESRSREESLEQWYKSKSDAVAYRTAILSGADYGSYLKGALAAFDVDVRDPTIDRRVVEYCLKVPAGEYIRDGVPRGLARRAFAERLPKSISGRFQRGYQGADWYEKVESQLPELRREAERVMRCAEAADPMDVDWLRSAIDEWPDKRDWSDGNDILVHRHGLLRAVAAGHFMRKISGTN